MPPLVARGCRVIVPSLRGFGGTRFLDAATPRSGEQAALGQDLKLLMDALQIEHAVVPGVGHNMPQEVPALFAQAVLRLARRELGWAGRRPVPAWRRGH